MPTFPLIRKFTGGLDRDSDARLIKEGDYYYALNMRNISSEGATEGVIENIKGTTEVPYTFYQDPASDQVTYMYFLSSEFSSYELVNGISTTSSGAIANFNVGISQNLNGLDPVPEGMKIIGNLDTLENIQSVLSAWITENAANILNTYGITVTLETNISDANLSLTNMGFISEGQSYAGGVLYYALKFTSTESFYLMTDHVQSSVTTSGDSSQISYISSSQALASQDDTATHFTVPEYWIERYTQTDVTGQEYFVQVRTVSQAIFSESIIIEYRCIGTYENTQTDKVYYFLASLNDTYRHTILEYDIHTNSIDEIFRDCGSSENKCFNWRKEFLINDIDMIGDKLYWTSPYYGEPKSLNIRRSKNSMKLINALIAAGTGSGVGFFTTVNQDPDISPYSVDGVDIYPDLKDYYPFQLYDANYSSRKKQGYVNVIKAYKNETGYYNFGSDPEVKRNNVIAYCWQFRQRYHYYDKEVSAWGPMTNIEFTGETKRNSRVQAEPGQFNYIRTRAYYGNGDVEFIELCARKNTQDGDNRGNRKKGNKGEFFSIAKIDNDYEAWRDYEGAYTFFNFYNDKIYSYISQLESDKNYDNVPKNALTQTLLGNNRIAYGNYFEGFDLPNLNITMRPLYGYMHVGDEWIDTRFFPYWTTARNSLSEGDEDPIMIDSFGWVGQGDQLSSSEVNTSANNTLQIETSAFLEDDNVTLTSLAWDMNGSYLIDGIFEDQLAAWLQTNYSNVAWDGTVHPRPVANAGNTWWGYLGSSSNAVDSVVPGEDEAISYANYTLETVSRSLLSSCVVSGFSGNLTPGSLTDISTLNSFNITEDGTANPLGSGMFTASDSGGADRYPKIRLVFNMDFNTFVFRPDVHLKLKWAFRVQKEYRSGDSSGYVEQTPTQKLEIDVVIPNVPGNDTRKQCRYIAEYLTRWSLDTTQGNSELYQTKRWNDPDANKPEQDYTTNEGEYQFGWNKKPICYHQDGKSYLVLEWVAPKKNNFTGTNPDGLSDDDFNYRLVACDFNTDDCDGTSLVINHPWNNGNNGGDNQLAEIKYNVNGSNFRVNMTRWHLGSGTYKAAAFHSFGLIYYDENGRASTVAVDSVQGKEKSMKVYVKGQGQRGPQDVIDPDTGVADISVYSADQENNTESYSNSQQLSLRRMYINPVSMQWKIYHKPPSWAKKFRFAYAKNTSIDDFVQFRLLTAKVGSETYTDENDTLKYRSTHDDRIYVHASGLLGNNKLFEGIVERDQNSVWNPLGGLLSITDSSGGVTYKKEHDYRIRFITKGHPTSVYETAGMGDEDSVVLYSNTLSNPSGGMDSPAYPLEWTMAGSLQVEGNVHLIPHHNEVRNGDVFAEGSNIQTKFIDIPIGGIKYIYYQGKAGDAGVDYEDYPFVPSSPLDNGWWLYFYPPDEVGYRKEDVQSYNNNTEDDINGSQSSSRGGYNFYENAMVEVYKGEKGADKDQTIYYEWGKAYKILESGGELYHQGEDQDQSGPYSFAKDANGETINNKDYETTVPAMGVFDPQTDCYMVCRNMKTTANFGRRLSGYNNDSDPTLFDYYGQGTDWDGYIKYYCEDYGMNDFAKLNHTHVGRFNVYSPYARNERKLASVTWSDIYQPDVGFNGLSSFNVDEGNWKDFDRVDGSIQKIKSRDADMVLIQEDKTYRVPVDKNILMTASGQGQVGVSSDILGTKIPYWGQYGISKNPESFVANGNVFYWVDIKRGAVLRLSRDGFTVISDNAMADYFRDKAVAYKNYDPQYNPDNEGEGRYNWGSDMLEDDNKYFRILGGFNPKHNEYIITFPLISNLTSSFDGYDSTWDGTSVNPEAISETSTTTQTGETISWSERQNRWLTFYSHHPDYYGKGNKQFISWKEGKLYLHDNSSEYNNFYGTIYDFKLDFYLNGKPSMVKGFKALQLEANQAKESTSAGVEESTDTGYDVTLITELGETTIDRNNWDEREAKQYAVIPYNSSESVGVGGEYIGIGIGTLTSGSSNIDLTNSGFRYDDVISANLYSGSSNDPENSNYGDQIYGASSTSSSASGATLGTPVLLGTVAGWNFTGATNRIILGSAYSGSTLTDNYFFIKRQGVAEGDRMKGRYMRVQISKKSKQLIELFTAGAVIQNSELSDD